MHNRTIEQLHPQIKLECNLQFLQVASSFPGPTKLYPGQKTGPVTSYNSLVFTLSWYCLIRLFFNSFQVVFPGFILALNELNLLIM
jgi:hypothetical protein